jgi:hypothetical protein
MNINVPFSPLQIIWALLFAGQLVLLVVLLGRVRTERFRWFTASIVIAAIRQLVAELLFQRIAEIPYNAITLSLAILSVLATLIVLIELARILFPVASVSKWLLLSFSILLLCTVALYFWGPWPPRSDYDVHTQLGVLRLLQLGAIRGQLFAAIATVLFGLVAIFPTQKSKDFWSSHAIKILAGLTTFALTLIVTRALGQWIANLANAQVLPQADHERTQAILDRLQNVPMITMIIVQCWWIRSLWIDEGKVKPVPKSKLK